ncbi:MAG: hypothetical protein HQK51_17595 [Oligoflexia bacterium]|nr:hypothetical protein [Oligoflexia bacterium]
MEDLRNSIVHKNLEMKIKLLGIELADILLVLFLSSVMNLIFGRTSISWIMVFIFPMIVGVLLHFGKKNKPENFIIHFIKYHLIPGQFAARDKALNEDKFRRHIND